MTQFRPIALCNTIAKIIFKTLALKLKRCLLSVISNTQSAFVSMKLITDKVLLAYEAHHVLKSKKSGKKGFMSVKVDMLSIPWRFLREILVQLGFSTKWITTIIDFVESVSYSVLVNGKQFGFIKLGRGLRQGDSLSPYLYIIYTEGLISLLKGAQCRGELNGIPMGGNVEPMTHLMFVNDILLLGKATVKEATIFK
ncbi:hypothetical protein LIER_38526 [Lithospermum erythrorhizon]|uniref:Reverse transcriptase domain-containing protein n=1 Tax=Lithospermum erythrorhizon TaxID=34254 RepID=A0AAV3Q3N0_LITER